MIARVVLAATLVGLAILYYFGFGPRPTPSEWAGLPWWRPQGFLIHSALTLGLSRLGAGDAATVGWPAVAFFSALPLGLGGLALRVNRGAVTRTLLIGVAITASLLAAFGLRLAVGWSFFSWRFPWVVLCTSLGVAAIALAPSLLEWLIHRRLRDRALTGVAVVLGIYLASTEITGWDPSMAANLTLWPLLTVFGLLLFGSRLASLHLAAGLGSLLAEMRPGALGRLAGAAIAGAIGALLGWALSAGGGLRWASSMGLTAALYGYWAGGHRPPTGALRSGAGAILLAAITLSNAAGERNHRIARDETAALVTGALSAYHEKHDAYPEELEDLVPEELAVLPEPRIGWIRHDGDRFSYLNFGDSYALEFPSIQWIQCSYSPPYTDPYADADADGDEPTEAPVSPRAETRDVGTASGPGAELGGSWTCDSTPPKLF